MQYLTILLSIGFQLVLTGCGEGTAATEEQPAGGGVCELQTAHFDFDGKVKY